MKIILNINRQFIPTFVFLIFSLTCYTQITFNKTIDINLGYDNAGIVKEDESGYLFIGNGWDFDFGGWTSLKLCKTDLEGNELWHKTFGEEGIHFFSGLNYAKCDDNFLYLSGGKVYADNESNVTFIKLDTETGDTIFVKEFIKAGFQTGYRINWLPDSTLLIFGSSDEGDSYSDILLMRIDTLGNVLFDESYGTNGYNLVYYFILDDSGYIYINFKENGCEPSGYYLYTIDYDGNLIDSYHTSEDCAIWLVPSEYNDGFFMASVYDYFLSEDAFFAKLNNDMSYSWQNYFEPDNVYYPSAQIEMLDGSVIVYGTWVGELNKPFSFLRKIGNDGITIWERVYDFQEESNSNYLYVAKMSNDGGYICAGSANGEPQNEFGQLNQNFWILKLDSMGCLIAGCDTIGEGGPEISIEVNTASIVIYPNPIISDAIIQIDLEQFDFTNLSYFEIELIDLYGKIIDEFTVDQFHWTQNGDKVTIPFRRDLWVNGIYFLRIKAGIEIIGNEKIILQ